MTVSQGYRDCDDRVYMYWQYSNGVQPSGSVKYELRSIPVNRTTRLPLPGVRRTISQLGRIASKEASRWPTTAQREFKGSIPVTQLNYSPTAYFEFKVRWASVDGTRVSVWSPPYYRTAAAPPATSCNPEGRRYW